MVRPKDPTRLRHRLVLLPLVLLLFTGACARHPQPVTTPPPSSPAARSLAAVQALQGEFEQIFGAAIFDHALWSVLVQSAVTGEVLYRLNPTTLMMPASNMKIVTMAVAAERLGWDYRFETSLVSDAPIVGGVLRGDLVAVGTGDPSISGRGGDRLRVFNAWAQQLANAGVRVIDGGIIGDDSAFEDAGLGAGWSWDDLAYGYAAPGGALQFNENTIEIVFRPGDTAGDPAGVETHPEDNGLTIVNRVVTTPAGGTPSVVLQRLPGQSVLEVSGSVPVGAGEFRRIAAVDNPTRFFVRSLRTALLASGIEVRGDAFDLDDFAADDRPSSRSGPHAPPIRRLAVHTSPPLRELGTVLMKVSQNLYAETLLKTIGREIGAGSAEAGREVVRRVLTSWGIPPEQHIVSDGSGLSRYNYLTADMLVKILRRMYLDPKHSKAFLSTLPVAGHDGTLAHRMKGTRAEGNARAKTGFIANARSLSGYVRTAEDELLAFAIIANNFHLPGGTITATMDLAVERLANFSRR
jgi:serine-type D-Ala-D-Ala carboxypeptidase/endopeptidase (penicillin-binding protein 4)